MIEELVKRHFIIMHRHADVAISASEHTFNTGYMALYK